MKLPNGRYRTKAGSSVEISGNHGGVSVVEFDKFEEPNACSECVVDPYPERDCDRWILMWHCEYCDGGCAAIVPDDGDDAADEVAA